jgi:rare lipoprotein A
MTPSRVSRVHILAVAIAFAITYGCATTAPTPALQEPEVQHGIASWYGQEFAGRTTANGEIFDPLLLTAAHRTLPFGTVADVKNTKSGQSVRVRINDRGPFVGNRMIDLSYAAAQQIGLIDPGSGDVELHIVKMGAGDREPPAPYVVTVAEVPQGAVVGSDAGRTSAITPTPVRPSEPPAVEFPLPAGTPAPKSAVVTPEPATETGDFHIQVEEVHGDPPTEVRRQVAPDGKSVQTVEVADGGTVATPVPPSPTPVPRHETPSSPGHSSAANLDAARAAAVHPVPAPSASRKRFAVQVGAFSIESNAKTLQDRLTRIGQQSYVLHDTLYRVRIGPFGTREEAVRARTTLEGNGISAIVLGE